MNALERKLLREQASVRWREAKRLRLEATLIPLKALEAGRKATEEGARHEALIERSSSLTSRSSEILTRSQEVSKKAKYLSDEAKVVLAQSSGSTFFEDLVDRAIDLRADVFEDVEVDAKVSLVASGELNRLTRVKQLVASLVPYTLGALDAGTALGVAIAAQPDLAIVDSNLEIAEASTWPLACRSMRLEQRRSS